MPRTAINVNGVDICTDYNCVVTSAPGFWDGFEAQDQDLVIPRRMGALLTAADPIVPVKTFGVHLVMRSATLAARRANEDALNALCYGSTVEVVGVDLTTRARYGRVQKLSIGPNPPEFIATESKLELAIRCQDPLAYELALTTIAFGSTRTAIAAGTTPFSPRTIIANATAGTLANFTLTQRNAAGDVAATMVLTGSLLTGEYLDVDHALMAINKVNASGTRSSARSWLTSGTYFVLRPGDQLEVNQGSGSALYHKSYF